MQGYNPELKVGMPAMIINVRQMKNLHMIGKMVTVIDLADIGDVKDEWFTEKHHGVNLKVALALIDGVGDCAGVLNGYSTIQQAHLMPLPPLDDDVIIEATEKPKETVKC